MNPHRDSRSPSSRASFAVHLTVNATLQFTPKSDYLLPTYTPKTDNAVQLVYSRVDRQNVLRNLQLFCLVIFHHYLSSTYLPNCQWALPCTDYAILPHSVALNRPECPRSFPASQTGGDPSATCTPPPPSIRRGEGLAGR